MHTHAENGHTIAQTNTTNPTDVSLNRLKKIFHYNSQINSTMDMYQCPECNKNYHGGYCQPCNSGHFRDGFKNWTSYDKRIDKSIQESQLIATDKGEFLEWIEYSNLENIEHVAEGGFGNVYKAIWKDGPITDKKDEIKDVWYLWDVEKSKWIRQGETVVAVKKYKSATNMSSEFLNEVKV